MFLSGVGELVRRGDIEFILQMDIKKKKIKENHYNEYYYCTRMYLVALCITRVDKHI